VAARPAVQAPKTPPPEQQTPAVQARPKERDDRVLFTIGVDTETFHVRRRKDSRG
jgi:hypothetical protein